MIKIFEAFAGYGSQAMALNRLGIDVEFVGISEIDKYAITAYNAVHGEVPNFGDIAKIDWETVPDFDLFTYSFPCTDISSAGQQKGFDEDSGTRSGLLWECKRAIEAKRPKYLLMENVKALTESKFMPTFRKWQDYLSSLGYSNFAQVLNAKDFGIPQNRERVFMVSILGDEWYNFPKPMKLTKCLGDVLESEVEEKYYLSQKMVDCFMRRNEVNKAKGNGFKFKTSNIEGVAKTVLTAAGNRPDDNFIVQRGRGFNAGGIHTECPAITSNSWQENNVIMQVGNLRESDKMPNPEAGRVYSPKGISPTVMTAQGGGREVKILGYTRDSKGKVSSYHEKDLANTIHTSTGSGGNTDQFVINDAYIRKLTPKECLRLMGVNDEDIEKMQTAHWLPERDLAYSKKEKQADMKPTTKKKLAKQGISNTQLYKMAGNSIVVDVLVEIFRNMFIKSEVKETLFG